MLMQKSIFIIACSSSVAYIDILDLLRFPLQCREFLCLFSVMLIFVIFIFQYSLSYEKLPGFLLITCD